MIRRSLKSLGILLVGMAVPIASGQQRPPLVPEAVSPSPLVTTAISAEFLDEAERAALRIRHGLWSEDDLLLVPGGRARAAAGVGRWDLVADDPEAPLHLRAMALHRLGRSEEVEAQLPTDGSFDPSIESVRAAILLADGSLEQAIAVADEVIDQASDDDLEQGLAAIHAYRTRLAAGGGMPRDFETMLDRLGGLRNRVDRVAPGPRLVEGILLLERGNASEGVPALHEALALDPRSADAWLALGRLAARTFDFDGAERAADTLDRLAGLFDDGVGSTGATILRARAALVRNDPDLAAMLLDRLLEEHPNEPEALALRAATAAVRFDRQDDTDWLARLDAVERDSPRGWFEVGSALSFSRQYDEAAEALAEAIRRRPRWAESHVELGLLEMQAARDDRARAALETAVELDPYHKRAAFSLFLLEELDAFETTESEHFVLRHRPGQDEVVASGMLGPLERVHADLVERFRHEPDRKTVIELMPDHEFFAVRITGMPAIHTIAACTGPLIAIEVPRVGSPRKHLGIFDWLRVLRHEYAHTITLSQTRNRIPHWLTEAAAVSIEDVPRTYEASGQLASRWRRGELFDLDEINFAFVRPKRPSDRSMAYAQGAWMVEFMDERWGDQALVDLMKLYYDGVQEKDAISRILGIGRDEFHAEFLAWAGEQIREWGLDPSPSLDRLGDRVRAEDPDQREAMDEARRERLARIAGLVAGGIGRPAGPGGVDPRDSSRFAVADWPQVRRPPIELDDEALTRLLAEHPDHPDLLELAVRRRLRSEEILDASLVELLDRYAEARPIDPYPHRVLARHHLDEQDAEAALPHLVELDLRSEKDPGFALEIARQARKVGDRALAFDAAERASRMNAYDPATRELAASCAIEAGRLEDARRHISALVLLEPEQPRHEKRLRAVDRIIADRSSDTSE
ncbi:MAG: tetratricopeptide repeat protein [Phycisphaera sp.]|nr:tetratricopeptide repeat protein [Phycisphaera sp.]